MLKKIKLSNSTALLIGILFIVIGISMGFVENFLQRKEKVFSEMNILLYESEIPQNITSEESLKEEMEEQAPVESQPQTSTTNQTQYNYIGTLEIPKINLKRGFLDINSKYNKVDYNITVINGSTFPTEKNNNLILAAHSGVCSVCFFHDLFDLSIEDAAYITYNGTKYTYKLKNTYEVEKDGTVAIYRDYEKSVLTLITCTRYSNTKQTVFIFELEK